jgi:hypothetical protein
MPTGPPRLHSSPAHAVSKYWSGLAASGPKYVVKLRSTAARRSASGRRWKSRAASPPTKPKTTPGPPSCGESSNVALTGPSVETAVPVSPFSRQNGRG